MAMRYGYFDSEITGVDSEGMPIFDRAETSELFRLLFSKLITNGVLAKPGDCFQVLAGDNGLSIKVRPGFGMINGAFAYDASEATYLLAAAPTTHSRIDRVVLRCDYLNRLCEIAVKTGTPASTPAPPDLIQPVSGDCYELGLALVTISSNQSVITQSSIRDTRSDSSVCGYITQLIDSIDTDVFYAQLSKFMDEFEESSEARFSSWFNGVKGQLDEDAAGHLQNQIDDLKNARISDLTEMPETDLADTTVISSENTDQVTEKTKLSSLFSWIYRKLSWYFLNSYSEIMSCTKDGFVPTALGVKEGFEQINTNLSKKQSVLKVISTSIAITNTAGNGVFYGSTSISRDGHTAIGVVGWRSGQSHFYPADLYVSGNTLNYRLKNTDASSHNGTLSVDILYMES